MVTLFRPWYENIQNSQTLQDYVFHILQYFATELHNFTKFRKLFPTVLKLFSNLKVCTIGEWSIALSFVDTVTRCNFSWTCNAVLLFRDVKWANTRIHCILLMSSSSIKQLLVINVSFKRRIALQEKFKRVTRPKSLVIANLRQTCWQLAVGLLWSSLLPHRDDK